ncbi:PREDICTED: RCC1 and BTB domain-containing protein 1-like [Atta colombica]|uniref:RCC1 and BTB domain-containing protein 1-like n=1 Tax=Atta colombica TaxID=520822 RepID=UPI00084C58E2|nr:PREDICTED: RCC1 and BTB domain-containing protein 1-like [Atta colombica]
MSISLKFHENFIRENNEKQQNIDLITFKRWLALQSCIDYKNGTGHIEKKHHPTKVDIMFNKIIKLLIANITDKGNAFLITQDVEKYAWEDTSAKITFNSEIQSTDNEVENEIMLNLVYYTKVWSEGKKCSICQIKVKEKITCMSCGTNFYVVVTNNFKVACGKDYTLALSDKGKIYGWGSNANGRLNLYYNDDVLSPIMINIANVKKVSDIAVIDYNNFVKSSKDGLMYAWGFIFDISFKKPAICEYTNVFDISNSMIAHSPMSVPCEFTNEEFHILNDLETAFNDQSTSDLTIIVEKQSIYVHKAILKIRSTYFRSMLQTNYVENRQRVIMNNYYRYVVYKKFLEYLYTGRINLSSFENLLDLLRLADTLCEKNLQMDCIRKVKKIINISNVMYLFNLINGMNEGHHKEELMKYCFNFYFKNMTTVIRTEGFEELDVETKAMLIDKGNNFLSSEISNSGYLG